MRQGKRVRFASTILIVLSSIVSARVGAEATTTETQCTAMKPSWPRIGESIGIVYDKDRLAPVVERAIGVWRRCVNYGQGFPRFENGKRGSRTIHLRYLSGSSGGDHCGTFVGDTVMIYGSGVDQRGERIPCGSLALNLAHELGHILGLQDAPVQSTCGFHIMSAIDLRTNRTLRDVTDDECQLAGEGWLTSSERQAAEDLGNATSEEVLHQHEIAPREIVLLVEDPSAVR